MNQTFSIVFIIILLFSCEVTKSQVKVDPVIPLDGYNWKFEPEFSDEFNETCLDTTKWWGFNPAWHGRKPAFFKRENVAVKDGMLHLTARVQKPEEVTVENKVRGYDKFTTSIIKSKNKIKYGYLEARCKTMDALVCNAFWLYDPLPPEKKYKEGSYSEEVDIFEVFGKSTSSNPDLPSTLFTTVHRFDTPYVESIVKTSKTKLSNKSKQNIMPFQFKEEFHVYGFLWTSTEMKWFVDGKEVFSRNNDYYSTALHIMFDCEIMKDWVGLPDSESLPDTFFVDYLRVWTIAEK